MSTGNTSRRIIIAALALAMSALACSAPGQSGSGPAEPTQPPAKTVADCPKAGDGTQAYVSEKDGLCFLVPSEMKGGTVFQMGGRSVGYSGPPLDPKSMEPVAAHIEVAYNGPADVAGSEEYAKKWHEVYGQGGPDAVQTTVAGQQVSMLPDVPGMMPQQVAFVIANGQKYTITSTSPNAFEDLKPQVEKAWSTVTESIVFFPPTDVLTVTRAEDVCPQPKSADELQLIDWGGGVCMLYPATFHLSAEFSRGTGWFEGPEVLGDIFGRPLSAELVINNGGPAEGKTPRQLWEPRLVNKEVSKIDADGAQDTTLSGHPAIVWTEGAPLGSRQAIIVANDRMYTVVNQPYNDPNFPKGAADVELIWKAVTENLAFFDAWH